MKVYELMVIVDGTLDEDRYKKSIEHLEKLIKAKKGTVTALDEWGKRKLAYEIRKQDFGYYLVWRFTAETSEAANSLQSALQIEDSVLRSMITLANTRRRPAANPEAAASAPSATKKPAAVTE